MKFAACLRTCHHHSIGRLYWLPGEDRGQVIELLTTCSQVNPVGSVATAVVDQRAETEATACTVAALHAVEAADSRCAACNRAVFDTGNSSSSGRSGSSSGDCESITACSRVKRRRRRTCASKEARQPSSQREDACSPAQWRTSR